MSEPRIKIKASAEYQDWEWACMVCRPTRWGLPLDAYGYEWELSKAADAGREHLRRFHGYSRRCGVSLAACEANKCRCVSVDPDALGGREKPVCDFGDDFPCCTHDNPLQAAHNEGVRR